MNGEKGKEELEKRKMKVSFQNIANSERTYRGVYYEVT